MTPVRATLIIALAGIFGGWLVRAVVVAVRTGVANAAGTRHLRGRNPLMYRLTILAQSLFAAACAVGVAATVRALASG